MLASQIERYIGLPYDEAELDCADLAVLLQRDLFGKEISLPGRRQRMNAPAAAINRYSGELASRIEREQLQDGDVIVFKDGTLHIGTVFLLSDKAWVLHTTMTGGYSLLQPLSDLPGFGLRIEGYYRWK
jgi:hypothetical protein